jgi:cytochrome P450
VCIYSPSSPYPWINPTLNYSSTKTSKTLSIILTKNQGEKLCPKELAMFIFLIIFCNLGFYLLSFFFSVLQEFYASQTKPPTTHGPPSYPIIGCLISFYKNRRCLLDWYTNLLSVSPTQTIVVQRLGARRIIVTANPENVEYVLKTNFINFPKGKPFTEILGDLLGCGIFNADGELWSTQRKLASHEFSTKSLREFVVMTLQEEVENRLIPLLEEAVEAKSVLDLQDLLRRFSFDIVCRVSLGTDPSCLDLSRPIPPLVKAFDAASEISAMRGMAPVYAVWKAKKLFNLGAEKKLKEAIKLVHDSVSEIVKTKKRVLENDREGKLESDLLSRLLLAGHGEEVVRDMVISFIMAGRDTTSAAMTWLFWLLSKHRNSEEMIVKEVKSLLDDGEKTIDYEVLKGMNFLKASLCESMRLYPPVPWDSKHAIIDDVLPDGTSVRKGDRVTYFPYGMGRMEKLWGKDRFEFRPDRWFQEIGNDQTLKSVSPYTFPVFQAGPRVCLGKEMAMIQMKYVMASVLRRFEIKPVFDNEPVFAPLLTAHMVGGLKVMVKRRNGNGDV